MAMPPTAGPSAGASTTPAPYMPIAMPLRSGGNTVKIVTMVIGMTMPAAMPCRTRPRMSMSIVVAVALISAPAMKTARVSAKPRRWPNASVIQALRSWLAVIVARKAVAIHCARSWPTPNAPMTSGTATLTMVADSTIEKPPIRPAKVTYQR